MSMNETERRAVETYLSHLLQELGTGENHRPAREIAVQVAVEYCGISVFRIIQEVEAARLVLRQSEQAEQAAIQQKQEALAELLREYDQSELAGDRIVRRAAEIFEMQSIDLESEGSSEEPTEYECTRLAMLDEMNLIDARLTRLERKGSGRGE